MFSQLVRIVFSVFLIAGVPVLSWRSARPAELREIPKTALYFSAIVSQWILAALGLLVVILAWPGHLRPGWHAVPVPVFFEWAIGMTLVSLLGLGLVLILERHDWWPDESEMVHLLLPDNPREKLWAILGLAPTAGLCEEFLYRGFLLAEISLWCHSVVWGAVLSSIAFGFAHVYQGVNGMARAALLGGLLAYPVVRFGSIYPSMAAHFLIDAVALLWLGPRFVKQSE